MRLLVAVNMSASGKATQAAVAAEADPRTFRKTSSRKALDKSKASKIGYLELAEDALCKCEVAGTA
jgi:hypothetical protein